MGYDYGQILERLHCGNMSGMTSMTIAIIMPSCSQTGALTWKKHFSRAIPISDRESHNTVPAAHATIHMSAPRKWVLPTVCYCCLQLSEQKRDM